MRTMQLFTDLVALLKRLFGKRTPAKTPRELELEDLLTSAKAIAERCGVETAWERFATRLTEAGIGSATPRTFKVLPSDLEKLNNLKI